MRAALAIFSFAALLACSFVAAHSRSSSRIYLEMADAHPASLVADVALLDLAQVVDLDRNADGRLSWGEVNSSQEPIVDVLTRGMQVNAREAECILGATARDFSLISYADVPHLRIRFKLRCPPALGSAGYSLSYRLFHEIDPEHRALLRVSGSNGDRAYVLAPGSNVVPLSGEEHLLSRAAGFVGEGFHHILSGYDHLVFLLLLILPAAAGGPLRTRLLRIGVIVTAFTLAHSITLAAATTGFIQLPARPVEIAIAASIVFAAVLNIVRPQHRLSWKIAFAFGLLHGFGFAGALAELGLERGSLLLSLVSFNIGVELGQLLVVALILPVLAALAASARYRTLVVPAASLACAVLGAAWMAARMM